MGIACTENVSVPQIVLYIYHERQTKLYHDKWPKSRQVKEHVQSQPFMLKCNDYLLMTDSDFKPSLVSDCTLLDNERTVFISHYSWINQPTKKELQGDIAFKLSSYRYNHDLWVRGAYQHIVWSGKILEIEAVFMLQTVLDAGDIILINQLV